MKFLRTLNTGLFLLLTPPIVIDQFLFISTSFHVSYSLDTGLAIALSSGHFPTSFPLSFKVHIELYVLVEGY